jgi:L-serine kinase (ADP)
LATHSSGKGFEINNGKIPILLVLKRIQELKPHEETVPTDLHGIVNTLKRDPILRHPVVADATTGAVLDGNHRLAALSELGCYTIPTALIDYENPLVKVDRWFRVITGENLNDFIKLAKDNQNHSATSISEADRSLLARSSYAGLGNKKEWFTFNSNGHDAVDAFQKSFRIEEIARNNGLKITYTDNDDLKQLAEDSFMMSTIRVEKREVVESCMNHRLFPPKSTRHLIPSRPLGLAVPLDWLKNENYAEAESIFVNHVRSKHVKRLAEGSKVGSRRYLEEVFLFE